MTTTTTFHRPARAEAYGRNGTEWLQIENSSGSYVAIYMPFAVAKAMADAFNAAQSRGADEVAA